MVLGRRVPRAFQLLRDVCVVHKAGRTDSEALSAERLPPESSRVFRASIKDVYDTMRRVCNSAKKDWRHMSDMEHGRGGYYEAWKSSTEQGRVPMSRDK